MQELVIDIPAPMWQTSNQRLHHMERARRTKHVRTLAGWQARKLEPVTGTVWPGVAGKPICDACDQMWPCATIRALEG